MDTKIISTITSHGPGYLNKDKEKIVGFQTDKPFKRSLQPYGGIRMAMKACEENGYKVDPQVVEFFTKHRKTHNDGVFDAYTPEMRACRSSHIITGLPDAWTWTYHRGLQKSCSLLQTDRGQEHQKDTTRTIMYSDVTRQREELSEQIKALKELKELGRSTDMIFQNQLQTYRQLDPVEMDTFGQSRSSKRTEWCCDVSWTYFYIP